MGGVGGQVWMRVWSRPRQRPTGSTRPYARARTCQSARAPALGRARHVDSSAIRSSAKEPARVLAAADGQRIERVTTKGAFSLVISEGQRKRTLDTGVTGVYPVHGPAG